MLWFFLLALVSASFNESLRLRPLPRNTLLASWEFDVASDGSAHYADFPRALGPIIDATDTRELHLRFTQGWWDHDAWGVLPHRGRHSGGTGVEVLAVVAAPSAREARRQWARLTNSLSGLFCASLNFVDELSTTFPRHYWGADGAAAGGAERADSTAGAAPGLRLYHLRAALPSEPVCTENLTPFLKLLPSRGKAGVASLLEGHKVFDSLWHGMAVDVWRDGAGRLQLHQLLNTVVDVTKSIRRHRDGGLPKPVPGDELRCDPNRIHNVWQCFPLMAPTAVEWDLETIFGHQIEGPGLLGAALQVYVEVGPGWNVSLEKAAAGTLESSPVDGPVAIAEPGRYNLRFATANSDRTAPVERPPILASRSLTGYLMDQGGLRIQLTNPLPLEAIEFVYFELLPWFMRLYLHTMVMEVASASATGGAGGATGDAHEVKVFDSAGGAAQPAAASESAGTASESAAASAGGAQGVSTPLILSHYYKPAIDRQRPSHLELTIALPPATTLNLHYQFDKSLLLYAEYPPDANHGFMVEPAVVTVLDPQTHHHLYEVRTTSLLVTLPTPDFSMPYNVIILTSTVMALVFGLVFNLLIRRVVTEEEADAAGGELKAARLAQRVAALARRARASLASQRAS